MSLRKDMADFAKLQRKAGLLGLEVELREPPAGEYGDIFAISLDGKVVRKAKTLTGALTWVDGFEVGLGALSCGAARHHEPASTSGESR